MDITGHFESASCVIEVDRSDTLEQVKGKLVAELGVPRARHVGVRMRGGGDIGNDDLRICDTEMDEGCAVELYCTGANINMTNIKPGLIPRSKEIYSLTLSPCDRYLAVMHRESGLSIFHTETHEHLCLFRCLFSCTPAFSPCSEWISCVNSQWFSGNQYTQRAEVRRVETGALRRSFGGAGGKRKSTAWSPCGTKLLSWCKNKGLQVWNIATGDVVHEWSHIADGVSAMVVAGDKVAMFGKSSQLTVWDCTTEMSFVLTCPSHIGDVALSPNQGFIAASCLDGLLIWNIETRERVFEDFSGRHWTDVAVSNYVVAAYSSDTLCLWSISTGKPLLHRDVVECSYGLAISSCGGVVMYGSDEGVEIVDSLNLS